MKANEYQKIWFETEIRRLDSLRPLRPKLNQCPSVVSFRQN